MNNCASPLLETSGIIKEINHKILFVEITINEACHSCNAKKNCVIGSTPNTRIIEIAKQNKNAFQVGDAVTITMQMETGLKAVLIAYIAPFLLFLSCMIIMSFYNASELKIGIYSIATIAIYYISLYLLRSKVKKSIMFSIKD